MPNYLQALRECCRDEAAFVRLQQILAATGESVTRTVCQCATQYYPTHQSVTTTPSRSNQPPTSRELRPSEERFQRMAANIPGIIFQAVQRPDGYRRLLFASSGCRELFEIEPELAQEDQSLLWNLIHPDDRPAYHKSVADAGANLQPWRWEGRVITKSGKLIWVQCAASLEQQDNGDVLWDGLVMDITPIAVSTDITKRKAAEAQIRAAAERDPKDPPEAARLLGEIALRIRRSLDLDEILNTTVAEVRQFLHADRVFISKFDENGQCLVVAESVDSQWPSIKEWVTDDTAYEEIKALFEGNRIQVVNDTTRFPRSPLLDEYHTRYHVKAGIGVPIMIGERLFGLLIANQCSGTRSWQQFEVDLLEQLATQVAIAIQQSSLFKELANLNTSLERQVEERTAQLQQKMQELQELHRVKDVVLHTVSHELRTSVMGTIMLFKNLLNLPGENITISRSMVERMIQGNERQLGMINSLLETHCPEETGVVLQRDRVQFGPLLEEIVKDLQPLLARSGATLSNQCKANLPLVMADATQIQRVVENLFNHALKRNPPGLHLTLKAKVEAGMLRCTIQDDGVGMSKIERDRLFDLYVRDPQGKCSTAIGMKLYLCRKIIQAHGGQIGVISSPKRGSTFWFTLPICQSGHC